MNINNRDIMMYKGKVNIRSGIRVGNSTSRVIYNEGTNILFSIIYDFLKSPSYAAQVDKDLIPTSLTIVDSNYKSLCYTKINAISIDKVQETDGTLLLRYYFILNGYDMQTTDDAQYMLLCNNTTDINDLDESNPTWLAKIIIDHDKVTLPSVANDVLYITWDLDFINSTTQAVGEN